MYGLILTIAMVVVAEGVSCLRLYTSLALKSSTNFSVPLCTTLHPSLALKIHSVPHPSWHRKRFALLLTAKAFLPEIAIKGEAHLSLLML